MVIPPEIVNMSLGDSFRFYRDELKWQVYPVYPRTSPVGASCKHPGKQPAVAAWWKYDPHDCDIASTFQSANPFNIGVAPRDGVVFVDLDSKHDQGASVRRFLEDHAAKLSGTPRHLSGGGAHLPFYITDLPAWKNPKNGKPFHDVLETQINADVKAELYHCDHNNLVLPPSVHPSGFVYSWDLFGEIRGHLLKWLFDLFGFEEPKAPQQKSRSKTAPWHTKFKGDLRSLDLIGLFAELGLETALHDADEARYGVRCPWHDEHSDPKDDSGTYVCQPGGDKWPQFYCHHSCSKTKGRGLREVLEWAEVKVPGIVDRFCARTRIWIPGAPEPRNAKGLPQVVHPIGRLESTVYNEIGEIIAPHHVWYVRSATVNMLEHIPSGFVYSDDPSVRYQVAATLVGFRELTGIVAKGALEKYMEPGVLEGDADGNLIFVPKSFSTDFCSGLIQSDQLKKTLPRIARILPVPLPFKIGNQLVYPRKEYDPRFATYLLPDAPELYEMPIEEARKKIQTILSGFCFTNEQSRTHAIARMLTPFARALLGWTTRVPLWFFLANRPRSGKDYLSGCTLIIYEGAAFEDLPIGKDPEETAKRIMAAARNGRRFMHFSNCQIFLQDQYLTQALTNQVINGRRLGSNDATSDLSIPNEMEFSISGNIGLTFREDLEPRMRKIELAFFEEDANSRTFPDKFLHRTIKNDRAGILSAIAAIYQHWAKAGFPKGTTPFTTYPEWAEIVGGVMIANGYGDPCLPFKGEFEDTGGDNRTAAMTALFQVCADDFNGTPIKNKQIFACVKRHQHFDTDFDEKPADEQNAEPDPKTEQVEALRWYGQLDGSDDAHKNQGNLMRAVRAFKGRVLGGVKLVINETSAIRKRHTYQFLRLPDPSKDQTKADSDKIGEQDVYPCTHMTPSEESIQVTHANPRSPNNLDLDFPRACDEHENGYTMGTWVHPEAPKTPILTDFLALDLETCAESQRNALNPWKGDIRLLTLADDAGNVQLYDLHSDQLPAAIRDAIGRGPIIAHNAVFDLLFLTVKLGIKPPEVFDTLTASRLLTPSRKVEHGLGAIIERYLALKIPKELGASDWGGMLLTPDQLEYARNDVLHLHQLKAVLETEIEKAGLAQVFKLESDLIPVVVEMEQTGFAVDKVLLQNLRAQAEKRQRDLGAVLREKFGLPTLNPDSPAQLLEAFRSIGVVLPDTNEATLKGIEHDLVPLVLEYRGASKFVGTTTGLLKHILPDDGRIHARFNSLGTDTGRFSSSKPNLQNITRGELRKVFVPSGPDRRLIVADYSQIELRIAALIAGDEVMLAAFRNREDLHRKTAAAILSKAIGAVTKDDRQLAKSANFGLLYGMAADGFQAYTKNEYGLTLTAEQATEIRGRFFDQYQALRRWHQDAWRQADSVTEARTIIGRRLLPNADTSWARFGLLTNYRVQGSAADLIKVGMVKLAGVLPSDAHLVATVHDELILDVPESDAIQLCGITQYAMQDAFKELFGDTIPVEVDAKVCANWSEK